MNECDYCEQALVMNKPVCQGECQCPECIGENAEIAKDRIFDEKIALGYFI